MTDKNKPGFNVAQQLGRILAKQMMKDYVRFCEKHEIPVKRVGDVVMLESKIFAQIPEDEHTNPFEDLDETPEWLEELEGRPDKPAEFSAEKRDRDGLSRTPCLILCGSHEFGTQSYAGEMRFYRNPEDNVQVAIPNGMRWGTAVGNLKKVTEDLEFWISVRTDTTIEDLDMITEREIDSPFPPF